MRLSFWNDSPFPPHFRSTNSPIGWARRVWRAMLLLLRRRIWPIVGRPANLQSSTFVILSYAEAAWIFVMMVYVTIQVSPPYNRNVRTFEPKDPVIARQSCSLGSRRGLLPRCRHHQPAAVVTAALDIPGQLATMTINFIIATFARFLSTKKKRMKFYMAAPFGFWRLTF